MRNLRFISGIATISLLLFMSNAYALNLGTNITINDGVLPNGVGQGGEDQEVEWSGNDNLMGHNNPVPEPATMLLFGSGLIGLAVIGRRKFSKKS